MRSAAREAGSNVAMPTSTLPTSGNAKVGGVPLATGDKLNWATTMLTKLGMPTTKENLKALSTWMAYEGGHWNNTADYNPLNTTQGEKGAKDINSVGVKSYTSWDQGYQATIETLNNGRYGNILSALKAGNNAKAVMQAVDASPWGTHIPASAMGGGNPTSVATPSMSSGGTVVGPQVTINVTVASASEAETMRLVQVVKNEIEKHTYISTMGRG
jgi:hypothetical protein